MSVIKMSIDGYYISTNINGKKQFLQMLVSIPGSNCYSVCDEIDDATKFPSYAFVQKMVNDLRLFETEMQFKIENRYKFDVI